ncbi:MAG: hypothetical protein KF698_07165 [Anaerolineales bacterium]|nr:hypothetical protein [Anaerolineales bacterium]
MHSLRKSSAWILILLLTLLAACSSAPAIPTSTPTLPSGGGDTSGAGSVPAGDPGGSQDAATGLDEPVLGITPPEVTPPPVPTPRPGIQGASNPPEAARPSPLVVIWRSARSPAALAQRWMAKPT